MTIPEISPLFLFSICGLSLVCTGFFGVAAFMILQFTGLELFEFANTFWNQDEQEPAPSTNAPAPPQPNQASRPDLRSRARSMDFDEAIRQQARQSTESTRFGENTNLRPDRRNQPNPSTRDLNLSPTGDLSDNPDAVYKPPPPDFSSRGEHLPNTNSNVGGRVGRWNTGRGQEGQRMDASGSTPNADGLGKRPSGKFDEDRRSRRNSKYRDDEIFGGILDSDGDGDPDA